MLLGPVLLSVFMARSFASVDIRRPELAVWDPGQSGLVRALQSSELIRLVPVDSSRQGEQKVREGKLPAALTVPADFDSQLEQDQFPRLDLVVDDTNPGQVALIREAIRAALRQQAGQEIPADIRVMKVREFTGAPRKTLLPIWVVFTVLGGLTVTASTLVEEKEKKTLAAILAAPVELWEVLAGKTLAGFSLAFGAAVLVLALNQGLGPNWATQLVLVALGSLLFAALGTLVGLSVKGQAAANAAISGLYAVFFMPVALADISHTMRMLASWTPTYYLQTALNQAVLGGSGLREVAGSLAILTGAIAAVLLAGLLRLQHYTKT